MPAGTNISMSIPYNLFNLQGPKIKQFMDVFSIPEMTLLAVANDYFISNDIEYDPVHLYKDVSVSSSAVHLYTIPLDPNKVVHLGKM